MTISPHLDRRFREAALALELVDLGFDVVESPIGPLFVAASHQGLASISFDARPEADGIAERGRDRVGERAVYRNRQRHLGEFRETGRHRRYFLRQMMASATTSAIAT